MDKLDTMTIVQASMTLKRSTKTIRRYIQSGALDAEIIGNRYFISRKSVAQLAKQPVEFSASLEKRVIGQLQSIEAKIDQLDKKLDDLATLLKSRQDDQRTAQIDETTKDTTLDIQAISQSIQSPLRAFSDEPENGKKLLTLRELAEELQIARSTLLGHVTNEKNGLAHLAIPKANRPGEFERYFNAEQAQVVRVWHREHTKGKR